jgi:hypothetical protein
MIQCFKCAYIRASIRMNPFIAEGCMEEAIQQNSVDFLASFEKIADKVRCAGPSFDFTMIPAENVLEFNRSMALLLHASAVGSSCKLMASTYLQAFKVCQCVIMAVSEKAFLRTQDVVVKTLKVTTDLLSRCILRCISKAEFDRFLNADLITACSPMLPKFKDNFAWTEMWTFKEIVRYNVLKDPAFVFTLEHEDSCITVDAYNKNADVLIELIQNELEMQVHSMDAIAVFSVLLEQGVRRAANVLHVTTNNLTFNTWRNVLRSGKMTWAEAVGMMDAVVLDMRFIFDDADGIWAAERDAVVQKRPNAISAFIHGLRVLWKIQRMANVHSINVFNRGLNQTTFQSRRMLSVSLDDRISRGVLYPINTKIALREVARLYPTLEKRILEKTKGSRFAFHGVFVAHVIFRRTTKLQPILCPETLTLEGPQLVSLQARVHRLSDAAIIINACHEEERVPVMEYMKQYTTELLPVFIPMMSHPSADRANFDMKNKREEFEKEFAKFLGLSALQLIEKTLPDELSCLQDQVDEITRELRTLIKLNRCVFYKLYGRLINELCDALKLAA